MIRAHILGIGAYVPERVVRNEEIPFLNDQHVRCAEQQTDTSDAWIRERSGIEERRYVPNDASVGCSDLAREASERALADANVEAAEVDCIILATLSPDVHFPGTGVFLQSKLGIDGVEGCACYDIRQQCSGFVYGLQMADAFVRAGLYRRVLLVGAEVHSHSLDYTTRGRDVMVLFGDGAGAVVIGPQETHDDRAGILYTEVHADGSGAWDLYLKLFEINKLPYVAYDPTDRDQNKTGLGWDEVDWFVSHQANLRMSQAVVEHAKIPPEKALNSIQWYGNTTAATVPLTIDHWRQHGRVKKGDLVLSTVFGSGYTWGAAIFRV
jgi:3-oxoacyl-[acyl-carrier-protein] synthase-3